MQRETCNMSCKYLERIQGQYYCTGYDLKLPQSTFDDRPVKCYDCDECCDETDNKQEETNEND